MIYNLWSGGPQRFFWKCQKESEPVDSVFRFAIKSLARPMGNFFAYATWKRLRTVDLVSAVSAARAAPG